MDTSAEYQPSQEANRPDPLSAIFQTVRAIAKRLTGFFTLSEEERLRAGIYLGGEGRDG
jgi:hypothetical protein